jgi:serine/threonine-protein kinase HipA
VYSPVSIVEVRIWRKAVGAVALDPRLGYYAFEYQPAFVRSGIELAPLTMPLTAASEPFVFVDLPELTYRRLPGMLADALPDDFGNALIDAWMAREGVAAGGARAKAVVSWNPATGEIRAGQFDAQAGFEHWLIKFDGVGVDERLGVSQDYGRIEYAYHLMARAAGITMSPCRLLEEHDRAHFMTKRFDRDGNTKHYVQTLCGLAHLDYRQKATHDASQLLLTIDRLGLAYDAKEEAFRRVAFNVIAANCDDHTKNISFLLREGGAWELAPAYDVTYAYNPKGEWTYQHLMSVNGKFDGISRADLITVADRFAIGTAPEVLQQINEAVSSWPDFASQANVSESEVTRIKEHHQVLS